MTSLLAAAARGAHLPRPGPASDRLSPRARRRAEQHLEDAGHPPPVRFDVVSDAEEPVEHFQREPRLASTEPLSSAGSRKHVVGRLDHHVVGDRDQHPRNGHRERHARRHYSTTRDSPCAEENRSWRHRSGVLAETQEQATRPTCRCVARAARVGVDNSAYEVLRARGWPPVGDLQSLAAHRPRRETR